MTDLSRATTARRTLPVESYSYGYDRILTAVFSEDSRHQ